MPELPKQTTPFASTVKPATPLVNKPVTFSFNETEFENKIKDLQAARDDAAGKSNYNPFLWYKETVKSFIDTYNKGDRSEALYKAVMAIPLIVPELKKPL